MSNASAALNESGSSDEEEHFHDAQESLGDGSSGEPQEGGAASASQGEPGSSKGGGAAAGSAEAPAEGAEPRGREEWPGLDTLKPGGRRGARGGQRRAGAPERKPQPPSCWSGDRPKVSAQPGAGSAKGPGASKAAPSQLWLPKDRPSKFKVRQERLGAILGRGGQLLKSIIEETGAWIDIDQSTKAEGYSTVRIKPGRGAARAKELIDARILAADAIEKGKGLEEMRIEQGAVRSLVGPGGETIQYIEDDSSACLKLDQSTKTQGFSILRIGGTPEAVAKAKAHVKDFLAWYKESGATKKGCSAKHEDIRLNQSVVGMVIGYGGETLRSIQRDTGAQLLMDQKTKDQGYSTLQIFADDDDAIDAAKKAIFAKIGRAAGPSDGEEVCRVQQSQVGFVMGRGGSNLDHIRQLTGATVDIDQSTRDQGYSLVRIGPGQGAQRARELVMAKIREAEALDGQSVPEETEDMRIEQRFVRRITKEESGQPFQDVKEQTGAALYLDRSTSWLGFSTLRISGSREAVTQGRVLVEKKLAALQSRAAKKRARRQAARVGGRPEGGPPREGPAAGGGGSSGGSSSDSGGEGPEGPGGGAPEAAPAGEEDSGEEICIREPCLCNEAVQEAHADVVEDGTLQEGSGLSGEALPEVRVDSVDGMLPKEMSAAHQENLRRLHAAWEEDEDEDEGDGGMNSASKSKGHEHQSEEFGDSSVASMERPERQQEGQPQHGDSMGRMMEGLSRVEGASVQDGPRRHQGTDGKSPAAMHVVQTLAPESIICQGEQPAQSLQPVALEDDTGAANIQTAAIEGIAAPESSDAEGGRAESAAAPAGAGRGRDGRSPSLGHLEAELSSAPSVSLARAAAAAADPCIDAKLSGDGIGAACSAPPELKDLPTSIAHGGTDSEGGGHDPLVSYAAREAEIGGGDMAAGGPPLQSYASFDAQAVEEFGGAVHNYPTGWSTSGQWVEDPWGNWCLLYAADSEWLQGEPWEGQGPGAAAAGWRERRGRRGGRRHRARALAHSGGAPGAGSPRPSRSCSREGGRPRLEETSSDESGDGMALGRARRPRPREAAFDEALEGADTAGGGPSEKVQETMKVPQRAVGWLIGRKGATIEQISARTGARLQFDQSSSAEGFSLLLLSGSPASVERARARVGELLREEAEDRWPRQGPRPHAAGGEGRSRSPPGPALLGGVPRLPARAPGGGSSSRLLHVVLNALLGRWQGRAKDGTAERYEVAVSLMPSRPNGAQLACRTVGDGGLALAELPIRYEGGDIFLGERQRLFLDVVSDRELVWVEERDPEVSSSWRRGWSGRPLGQGDGAGGGATDDAAQAETSGTDLDTEEDGLPGLGSASRGGSGARERSLRGHGRRPGPTSKELAMRFQ